MKNSFFLIAILFVCFQSISAKDGYKVEIRIKNYHNDTLIIGYYLGDKQFIKDTAFLKKGVYTFSGSEALSPGVYMAVLLPQKNIFQFLIDKDNQQFSIEADAKNLSNGLVAKNSPENALFFNYISYISQRKPEADSLKNLQKKATTPNENTRLEKQIKGIDADVKKYQDNILVNHPNSFTAAIINASQEKNFPDYGNKSDSVKLQLFNHYKLHFFDDFNFADERLFHSPVYFQKIDFYINKLTAQHPDSIINSLDFILAKTAVIPEAFQFYLSHYFNSYVNSKYVGMDAVYVHLIDKFYAKGKAPWVDEANLTKMKDAANDIRPTLIGRYAPNLTFFRQDGTPLKVHDIKADYTVLFFWAPDCHHCEKAIPFVLDFYKNYKDKGVEILAICTGLLDEAKNCWTAIEKKNLQMFVNVNDPTLSSNFKVFYDVKATPKFFILDKDKKILSKGLAGEQLGEVMGKIMELDKKK